MLDNDAWGLRAPQNTLIVACYKVERYLPDFLASLDNQTANHSEYELVFVIDGCPENSEAIVREWMQHTDYAVRLISKPNGGVASARNVGLDSARGEWISCPDPDDWLAPDYLALVAGATAQFPQAQMLSGRVALKDADGHPLPHPFDFRFDRDEPYEVDLAREPDRLQTPGGTVFLRRQLIERHQLRFDEQLPQASDSDFIARYLLLTRAAYTLVPLAVYEYRRRGDGSSIVDQQQQNVTRYKLVFGRAHRRLLELSAHETGSDDCPQWLANTILYFTFYLFRRNRSADSPVYETDAGVLAEIRGALQKNLRSIGAARIRAFRLHDVPLDMRAAWLAAAQGELRSSPVERLGVVASESTACVSFVSSNLSLPRGLRIEGTASQIVDSKARSIEYLGGTWAVEHILRLNPPPTAGGSLIADGLAFELGGAPLFADEIRHKLGQDRPRLLDTDGVEGAERLDNDSLGGRVGGKLARLRYSLPLRIADATGYLHRFNGAVVFEMTAKGGASLERLLRAGIVSPAVNAWAVAEAGSAAFASLRRAGLPAVAAGSIRHFLLLKRARAVVSVSVDNHLPFPDRVLGKSWSNVYLNDTPLGARDYWTLNPSHVDLIAADNAEERQRLCGDGGYYRFFPEETLLLTGYRDRLIAGAFSADDSTTLNGIVDALPG